MEKPLPAQLARVNLSRKKCLAGNVPPLFFHPSFVFRLSCSPRGIFLDAASTFLSYPSANENRVTPVFPVPLAKVNATRFRALARRCRSKFIFYSRHGIGTQPPRFPRPHRRNPTTSRGRYWILALLQNKAFRLGEIFKPPTRDRNPELIAG